MILQQFNRWIEGLTVDVVASRLFRRHLGILRALRAD